MSNDPLKKMVFLPCKHPIQEDLIKTAKSIDQVRFCLHCDSVFNPQEVYAYYFNEPLPAKTGSVEELAAQDMVKRIKFLNDKLIEDNKKIRREFLAKMDEYQEFRCQYDIILKKMGDFSKSNMKLFDQNNELLNSLKTTRKNKNDQIESLEKSILQLKGQIKKNNKTLESEKAHSANLNKKISLLKTSLKKALQDNTGFKEKENVLNQRIDKILQSIKKERKEKDNQLIEYKTITEQLKQEIEEKDDQLTEYMGTNEQLKQEIEEKEKNYSENVQNTLAERTGKEECIRVNCMLQQQLYNANMHIQYMQWFFLGGPPPGPSGPSGPSGPVGPVGPPISD